VVLNISNWPPYLERRAKMVFVACAILAEEIKCAMKELG